MKTLLVLTAILAAFLPRAQRRSSRRSLSCSAPRPRMHRIARRFPRRVTCLTVQECRRSSSCRASGSAYRLFVPPGYDGHLRLPLVLDLHGSGGTSAGEARNSGFETLSASERFIVATLDAEGGRWNVPGSGRPGR